jgi:hypothetical protein
VKKVKKSEISEKNRLEFHFALFRFEAKITKSKRREKFKVEKREKVKKAKKAKK